MNERLQNDLALIAKGAQEFIGEDDLKEKLNNYYQTGKPLVIKLGLDPSAPDIHLGHTVVLRKIRQFQKLGHKAMIIIGDFTGRIGDPTGKDKMRKQLSEQEVLENADTYQKQLLKVLDPKQTIICFNSEWLDKLSLKDMMNFMSKQSLSRMLEREGFKKRVEANKAIFMHELLYPMLQGFDSLAIEADVELGGMDQKFNILMGRDMQGREGKAKQAALFMPLIEGIDGKEKMSKSLGNYIGITESANVMYEKVMKIPDELIEKYFVLLTDLTPKEIDRHMRRLGSGELHPRALKMILAEEITHLYHDRQTAKQAGIRFVDVLCNKKTPIDMDTIEVNKEMDLIQVIVKAGFAGSNSDARRLILQKGVKMNQRVIDDIHCQSFENGSVLQVGKNKFAKLSTTKIPL